MTTITRRNFISKISAAAVFGGFAASSLAGCDKKKSGFKLGACDWTLRASGKTESFNIAKSIGLDGVQISKPFVQSNPIFATQKDIDAYKQAMSQTGLACASASPMLNSDPFVSVDGAVEYTCSSLDCAAALGAKTILLPFYGKANMQGADKRIKPELFAPLVARLKIAAAHAQKKGVTICLENSLNADDNIRIIEAVGSDFVKVYFDLFNFQYYGFETVPEMKKLKGYIGEIHLKDKGHKLDSGSGVPRDMNACFDAIKEIGYDGWLVFELHGFNPKKDGAVEDVLKHNIEVVKKSVLFS